MLIAANINGLLKNFLVILCGFKLKNNNLIMNFFKRINLKINTPAYAVMLQIL